MKRFVLSEHDKKLVAKAKKALDNAMRDSDAPIAVMKRIASYAVGRRNLGRREAMKRHPFRGVCEATGNPLKDDDKVLDEMEPEKGYSGKVRWTCPKCNNSGRQSCGDSEKKTRTKS